MKRLIDQLRDWYSRTTWIRVVVKSLPYAGPPLHEFLSSDPHEPVRTYSGLQGLSGEIDWQLMNTIGEFVAGPGKERRDARAAIQAYELQMSAALEEKNLTQEELLQWLQRHDSLEGLLETVPSPDLRIDFSKQRDILKFELRGGDSLTVEDPELLWDCTCNEQAVIKSREEDGTTDPTEQCPIHDGSETAEAVEKAFNDGLVEITYDGTSVYWKQEPQFWPPSVDAFNMAEDLESEGLYEDKSIKRVLDLGCGTGFLGQRLASKNRNINKISYSDWLLTPVVFSALNWYRENDLSSQSSIKLHVGIGVEQTEELKYTPWSPTRKKPFDLVVCNPPYLPLPEPITDEARSIPLESTVSGTALLQSIIRHAEDLTNRLYVAFSDIALPEARRAAGEAGYSLQRVGPERAVPFRVASALRHRNYIQWLLTERRLEYRTGDPHRLWHKVSTYRIA